MILPESELLTMEPDADDTLKPMFDIIWNAAGFPRSMNYNDQNDWIGAQ